MTPTEIVQSTMPLCATLGVTATEFDAERVVLHLDLARRPVHGRRPAARRRVDGAGRLGGRRLRVPQPARGRDWHVDDRVEDQLPRRRARGRVGRGHGDAASPGGTTIVVETELRTDATAR